MAGPHHEERPLPIGTMLLLGALVFGVYRQGAYPEVPHQRFAWFSIAAGIALASSTIGRTALLRAVLIVSPLLLSSAVSMLAASERGDARSTFLLIGLVAIGLAAGLSVKPESVDFAIDVFLLLAALVAMTAIWGVATEEPLWGRITGDVWRGSSSITYANGAAAIIGPGFLLAFWRSAATGARLYAAASAFLAVGFAATQSRGGTVALILAGLAMAVHLGLTRTVRTAVPITCGAAIGASLLLSRASTLKEPHTAVVLVVIVAGLAVSVGLWPLRERITNPGLVAGVGVGAAFAAVLLSPLGERFTLRSATTATGADGQVLFGDRGKEWATAWELFLDRPAFGHGPGNVDLRWVEDGRSFVALFVHNEYLELLVTHGVLGAVALVGAAVLAWRLLGPTRRELPILIALGAFLLHSSLDFLWHIPVLPVALAFVLGLARGEAAESEGSIAHGADRQALAPSGP